MLFDLLNILGGSRSPLDWVTLSTRPLGFRVPASTHSFLARAAHPPQDQAFLPACLVAWATPPRPSNLGPTYRNPASEMVPGCSQGWSPSLRLPCNRASAFFRPPIVLPARVLAKSRPGELGGEASAGSKVNSLLTAHRSFWGWGRNRSPSSPGICQGSSSDSNASTFPVLSRGRKLQAPAGDSKATGVVGGR